MPYEIKPENNQFCIYKRGTNDRIACHDTRDSANRQIVALYANENKSTIDFIIDFIDQYRHIQSGFKTLNENEWIAWYSNNFEDKEHEIVSLAALKDSIEAANNGDYPMPELWFMHLEGTRHGIAEKLFLIGHFAVAIGKFDSEQDNEFVSIMKTWYDTQDKVTVSQGFFYDPKKKQKGVYNWIRTREISSLPDGSEANSYTQFQILQRE